MDHLELVIKPVNLIFQLSFLLDLLVMRVNHGLGIELITHDRFLMHIKLKQSVQVVLLTLKRLPKLDLWSLLLQVEWLLLIVMTAELNGGTVILAAPHITWPTVYIWVHMSILALGRIHHRTVQMTLLVLLVLALVYVQLRLVKVTLAVGHSKKVLLFYKV